MTFKFPKKLPKAWKEAIERNGRVDSIILHNGGSPIKESPQGGLAFGVVPPVGKDLRVIIEWEDGSSDTYNKADTLPSDLSTAIRIHIENSVCKYSHNTPWLGTNIVCFNKLENETVELFLASVLELEYPDEYQMLDFDAQTWTLETLEWTAEGVKAHFTTTGFPVPYVDFVLDEPAEKLKLGYALNEVSYTKTTTETALRFQLKFSNRIRFMEPNPVEGEPDIVHEEEAVGAWDFKTRGRFGFDNRNGYRLPVEVENSWIKCSAKKVWVISGFGKGFASKVVDDNFGYETPGTDGSDNIENHIRGLKATCPEAGTADSITIYYRSTVAEFPTKRMKCAIYLESDNSFVGETEELTPPIAAGAWQTFNFSEPKPILLNVLYILVAWSESLAGDGKLWYNYDTVVGVSEFIGTTYNDFPDPLSRVGENKSYSIYCTYTAAGWTGKISGVTDPAKVMGVDVANIAEVKGVA